MKKAVLLVTWIFSLLMACEDLEFTPIEPTSLEFPLDLEVEVEPLDTVVYWRCIQPSEEIAEDDSYVSDPVVTPDKELMRRLEEELTEDDIF